MNYKDLFEFEHKILPIMLFLQRDNVKFLLENFSDFAEQFVPSCQKELFYIDNTSLALERIQPFLGKGDMVQVFHFPFKEDGSHIGLARYGFIVYKENFLELRYYILELFRHFDGQKESLWYWIVGYTLEDNNVDSYVLRKHIYENSVWFGNKEPMKVR